MDTDALAAELVESLRAQEEIQALSAPVVSSSLPSQYINVSEAAVLAGTTREMVYRAVRKGHLPAKDGPGGKVVDRADVLG